MPVQVKVKSAGRIRAPRLDYGKLTFIGRSMIEAQLDRWARGVNANGQTAKPLSVRYAIIKQRALRKRPIRDMQMTGQLIANFGLRKAINNEIRVENSTKLNRQKAQRAQNYEEMIGFAGSDQTALYKSALDQYGVFLKEAWVPLNF